MDRIAISLVPRSSELGRWTDVRLTLDTGELTTLATEFEQERGWAPAGGYGWLGADGLPPAQARLMGRAREWTDDGRTLLLLCDGCREEGCWPLLARVLFTDECVHWRDFQQWHRPERDYSDFRFTFDRTLYEAEIRRAFEPAAR